MTTSLVIKSPTQQVKDQKIECQLAWSVDQLKEHISEVYPTQPKKENQRLIYCGQLLPDSVKLKDILHHDVSEVHTLHLVCHQATQGSKTAVKSVPGHSNTMDSTPPSTSLPSSSPGEDGLRQRRSNVERPFNSPLPPVASGFPPNPVDVASQMALMQQAYAQYMSQYLMYIQSGGSSYFASPFLNTVPNNESTPTPQPTQESGVQNGPDNQNAGVEAHAPPPPVAAAAPQQNDDEVDANGDVLDYIYILSRFMILASILYIYSSFGRILLVSGLALLLYLYHNGRLSRRRRSRNTSNTAAVPNNGTEDPNRTPSNEQQGVQEDADGQEQVVSEMEGQNTSESHVNNTRSETSPVTAVWTFLTAFFSSLIPEQPIPVNIN